MSKQDRQGVRTAAEVERKHKFEKIRGTADSALSAAQEAKAAAEKLDGNLTQEEIFNRLTDNGKMKGIYMEDGELYINATYIKTGEFMADLIKAGAIKSVDGKSVVIDLDKGIATLTGSITTAEEADEDGDVMTSKITPTAIELKGGNVTANITKRGIVFQHTSDGDLGYYAELSADEYGALFVLAAMHQTTGMSIQVKGSTLIMYMNEGSITGLKAPTLNTDAANKAYVDEQIAALKDLIQ